VLGPVGVMALSQHDRRAFEAIVEGLCRDDPLLATRARREWTRGVRRQRVTTALACAAGRLLLAITCAGAIVALTAAVLVMTGVAAFSYGAAASQPIPVQARLLRARSWLHARTTGWS